MILAQSYHCIGIGTDGTCTGTDDTGMRSDGTCTCTEGTDSTTGCSKETVNCNFFLTDLKFTKSGITEPFLVGAQKEVLIF